MSQSTSGKTFRLILFGMLYFVQGASLAYFTNFQKPYLNGFGISADQIGLLSSLILVPFVLKIFIGILSDRVNLFGMGYRKPYMMLGLFLTMLSFTAAAFVSPGDNFTLYAALMLLGSFSITLFDSTTDGLAIDITPREEHGLVQGMMTGGRAAGFIGFSVILGALATTQAGYRNVFLVVAASILAPIILVLMAREPADRDDDQRFNWGAFKAFGRPSFMIFAGYFILVALTSYGINGLITYHMDKSFGAADTLIGNYGAIRGIGAVIGAVGCGLIFTRIGARNATLGGLIAISVAGALIAFAPGIDTIMALGIIWGLAWGFQDAVGVALAMDLADTRIAASMFAVMMAIFNIGIAVGEGLFTSLTDNIGFQNVFLMLAGINLVILPIAYALFRAAPDIGKREAVIEVGEATAAEVLSG